MSSPNPFGSKVRPAQRYALGALAIVASVAALRAGATSEWLEHAIANTPVEAALYRAMTLPGVEVLFPRPPRESVAELDKLVAAKPTAALYSLRARQEEAAQQFDRAEADWKLYVAKSNNGAAARVELANFYQRRHDEKAEFAERLRLGATTPTHAEAQHNAITPPAQQLRWQAFVRAMEITRDQGLDDATVRSVWQAWVAAYPKQPSLYQRAFVWELDHHHLQEAAAWATQYGAVFPADKVFAVKAQALLALRSGGPGAEDKALAVYDAAFQPLWPEELLKSYFALLADTHRTRSFPAAANARLLARPDDYEAEARVFVYEREQGRPQQALDSLAAFCAGKTQRHAAWSAQELYTFAQLTTQAGDYAGAARFDFALSQSHGTLPDGRAAHEAGLAGMVQLLLDAPDAATPLGAANLSMYRDIATLDQGPGYWNGVLSLWLNSDSPQSEYAREDAKAQPYFRRAKAAELLAQLDHDAPQSPDRAPLHAKLLDAYQAYGDDAAVLREGVSFLDAFPRAEDRVRVAFAVADVYARQKNTTAEFALYDRMLGELAKQAGDRPLTFAELPASSSHGAPGQEIEASMAQKSGVESSSAFDLQVADPQLPPSPAAVAYRRVLEQYLSRLTEQKQLPQALALLRQELDRDPDDPAIYDRLAQFLESNNLSAQTEELYRTAITRFKSDDWYSKLARFYLRHKRENDYAALTRNVTRIFSGTQVDAWFRGVSGGGPQLALQLNLYAHERFPHDTVFIENLLNDYRAKPTRDDAAWESLLRHSWWESPSLTQRYFEFLSSNGKLDAEVARLGDAPANPAAARELAEASMWSSHFEQSAPLYLALSQQYPSDEDLGTRAADLQRSLAWLDPAGPQTNIANAVAIEDRLFASDPGDTARLERIGDILADHSNGDAQSLSASAAYWRRIPSMTPGSTEPYLESATVFWDYFQFDDALHEIDLARTRFARPALFGYEAGAIDEARNDLPGAVKEYVAASIDTGANDSDPAQSRLLTLARRTATARLVDAETAGALASRVSKGGAAALRLRIAVLEQQQRAREVGPLLAQALNQASTEDEAAEIAGYAEAHDQPTVQEAALDRQASLARDPVERLRLRYALAGVYEGQNDLVNAGRVIDEVYRENPRLLGVVRATVDFDWRSKQEPAAVKVLLDAAHASQPVLARQFLEEASQKANISGDRQQARSIAESLLAQDPYNALDLSLAAATYTDDPAGLAGFYRARLDALRTASMSAQDRKSRTALLRRGLIPALTQAKDNAGAVEQYIALLSAYPEDESLVNEAALYALRYDLKQPWLDFLRATNKASPRDSRFFVDLALSEIIFDDPAAAAGAYAQAIAIRKDRPDWYIAKAALDDSLGRFDDEVADDTRLYQLTYQDPQWMVAAARTRVRQGREPDAIAALEKAFLHGAQSTPHDYMNVAAQLEQWNRISAAQHEAEIGARLAGIELLHPDGRSIEAQDATTYARILTRAHAAPAAMKVLHDALTAASSTSIVDAMLAEVKQQGPLSVTDSVWRARYAEMRRQEAAQAFNQALQAMCRTVDLYDTPEERASFESTLEAQAQTATDFDLTSRWVPAAETAHLADLQQRWRTRLLLGGGEHANDQLRPLVSLQRARLLFQPLLQTLETYVGASPRPGTRNEAMLEMLRIDADTGDTASLLRLVHQQMSWIETDSLAQTTVLPEIVSHAPQELPALAASRNDTFADTVANEALAKLGLDQALPVIASRGASLDPVWGSEYKALASLYGGQASPQAGAAFRAALAWDLSIGDRVHRKPDTAHELTGAPWFYLAARYGQWMSLPGTRADAESAIAADLEQSASVESYRELATTYAEAGHPDAALAQLGHALELEPNNAQLHDAQALLLWQMNRKPDALTAWRHAYTDLRELEDKGGAVPESFWSDFAKITQHIARRGLTLELSSSRDDVLRTYLARNGSYRAPELLQAEYAAWPDPKEGLAHLLALSSSSKDEFDILSEISSAPWLSKPTHILLLQRQLRLLDARGGASANGEDISSWSYQRDSIQQQLLRLYLDGGQTQQARALLESVTGKERNEDPYVEARIVVASRTGGLAALIAGYREASDAPSAAVLEAAAAELSAAKDFASARMVLEFVFARAQSEHGLAQKEYLLLAEARLHAGDKAGAVSLLQDLARSSGDTIANLDSAAALLEREGLAAEAIPFLTRLASEVPWEMSYPVRLAEAEMHAHAGEPTAALQAVASSPFAPYSLRVRAARDLHAALAHVTGLGSGELDLLAANTIDPKASQQPYFVLARAAAAEATADPSTKLALLREAIAIAPYGPESDGIRRQLFLAEYESKQMREARTVLDEWMTARSSVPAAQPWGTSPGIEDGSTFQGDNAAAQSTTALADSPALLDAMAAVYLATGDRPQAIATLQREAALLGDGAASRALRSHVEALQAETRLEIANALRRPVVHRELAQSNLVRVRLQHPPEDDVPAVTSQEEQP